MEDMTADALRQRLTQAEQALERCERLGLASQYSSAVMHEVNNPLEAITNLVYLTQLQKDEPDQVFENMKTIEEQLATLSRVTSQALTFHREKAMARDFDLVEIAVSALKLHADKLLRHGVSVERRFHTPAMARVHGSEILQVLSNLILNAVDALPPGQGRIWVKIKAHRAYATITVCDNGPGIPQHYADRLFEPYVTSKASGTGLGLWLSKRIVNKHRGSLRFRTSRREGRAGTIFRISLPLSKSA